MRLAVATFPHGSVARSSGGGYIVPSASHPGVSPAHGSVGYRWQNTGFVLPDKYRCDLMSHRRVGCALHMACAGYGTFGPFATSATRSRRRLPGTTRPVLRTSLAGSERGLADIQIGLAFEMSGLNLALGIGVHAGNAPP